MKFDLNEFLSSVSNVLDAVEIDLFGIPTNHSKRIAYISARIGYELGLNPEEIFDLAALSLMHDNGATMKIFEDNTKHTLREKMLITEEISDHCTIGENNIKNFPFLTNPHNIIKYHHENYDGSGFFGLHSEDIPLFAQIIHLADNLDLNLKMNHALKKTTFNYVSAYRNIYFSPTIADIFFQLGKNEEFWDLLHDDKIDEALHEIIPKFSNELHYKEVRSITIVLSKIIDAKSIFTQKHSSGLSKRMMAMAKYYRFDDTTKYKLLIATDLHDIGKLAISDKILDKPGSLTYLEFEEIKKHSIISKQCLIGLNGFEEIAEWIGNHHEKLDGTGYPNNLTEVNLDFNSRLIACLDIYQALREKRPYRKAMNHLESIKILIEMANKGKLDKKIVEDIDFVFYKKKNQLKLVNNN